MTVLGGREGQGERDRVGIGISSPLVLVHQAKSPGRVLIDVSHRSAVEDDDEWADGYSIDGVKVDTSGFLNSTIDRYVAAAVDDGDIEQELQVRITALLHGRALHGESIIEAWRSRCASRAT